MRFLKTNTATRVTVGPFLDKTDGITPEIALTVTACLLSLSVDTAGVPTLILDAAPTASGGANDMVHIASDAAGFYDLELAAADVNYVGRAMLAITDVAVHCPVFHEFMILPANVYDSLVLGTDDLDVQVSAIDASAITATSIATDAISAAKLAADASVQTAAAVWDRVLTGATHNIATSAGRRLRTLQDTGNYTFGAVWLDTGGANAGSTFPDDGSFLNPVNTLANALTVAAAATQPIKRLFVLAGSSITLAGTYNAWAIDGDNYTLVLNGQDLTNTVVSNSGSVTGTATGTGSQFERCYIGAVTVGAGAHFHDCGILGTLTVGAAGDFELIDCYSLVAGAAAPVLDVGSGLGATTISIRRWSGGLTLNNVEAGDVVSVDAVSGGTITVNGSGGTVHVRGMVNVVDGSGASVTITQTNVNDTRFDTLDTSVAAIPTTAMRGTDNAALASVATEARLAELDAANLPTDVAAIPTTAMRGTDSAALASVATEARLAELDAANLPADIAAVPTLAEIIAGLAPEVRYGTAQAGAATTVTLDAGASAVDDYYNGTLIFIVGGTGATDPPQVRAITDYVGSTKVATVATWGTNPDVTSVFVLLGLN